MRNRDFDRKVCISTLLVFILVCLSFAKIYIRTQTTLIGYRLGQSKDFEADLLETQSRLKMRLAEVSTKKSLIKLSASSSNRGQSE